jgi:DNA-binding CsgD family transcriptional regulator
MPTISQEQVLDLIGDIYECANDNSLDGWKQTYGKLSRMIRSGPGSLSYLDKRKQHFKPIADTNEPGFLDSVNKVYFPQLPFRRRLEGLRTGESMNRLRDCPDDTYLPTELYQDHFRRFGIYQVIHQCLFESDDLAISATFTRSEKESDFNRHEMAALGAVIPHLQRAIYLQNRLIASESSNQMLIDAWDEMFQGVIVISRTRGIILKNKAANEMLTGGRGITLDRKGMPTCASQRDTKRLQHLIHSVFAGGADVADGRGGLMLVQRPDGLRPLSLLVSQFSERSIGHADTEKLALILITDPEAKNDSFEVDLCSIFGLTPAEAHMASVLADGYTVKEACDQLHITCNTARTHLKHIFSKTDTNRQSTLVKVLLSSLISRRK